MYKKRLISCIVEIIIGISLIISYMLGKLDEFWCGMGTSLLFVAVFFIIRIIRYNKNDEYREKYEIEMNDERNKYISLKAWAYAGYIFILIAGIATVGFKLLGKDELMMIASMSISIIILLYWISYMLLRKKY